MRLLPLSALLLLPAAATAMALRGESAAAPVDFQRDVRPILSRNCFECHGNDAEAREADLRLDLREGATADLGGYAAVVPGDAEASELVYRITTDFADDRMPPADSGKALTEDEIAILTAWIEQGAPYARHWSFTPPVRPTPPQVRQADRVRNPVDAFVAARQEAAGLRFAPDADRRALLRRVSLDLTGIPPTPEEIRAFLDDDAPGAYARVVDRLLASPRYGERLAMPWLDAARYADTNGYHIDNERTMWPWRDHLIRVLNENQPFDRFTLEALAGDLLPEPTRAQLVATGFQRNHMINFEGGAIPEEYRNEYVVDRVNTTAKVWLGLTMNCAQCHDHKYDPVTQEEYYRLYAFYDSVDEKGLDGQEGNAQPVLPLPTPEEEAEMARLDARISETASALDAPDPEMDFAQARWEEETQAALGQRWVRPQIEEVSTTGGTTLTPLGDGSLLAGGEGAAVEDYELVLRVPAGGLHLLRLEALAHPDLPGGSNGRASNGNFVLSEVEVAAAPVDAPDGEARHDGADFEPVRFTRAWADHAQPPFPASATIDGDLGTGWAPEGYARKEARVLTLITSEPFGFDAGTRLRVRLRFHYGTHHAIGRLRLAVSGDAAAATALQPAEWGDWWMTGPFAKTEDGLAAVHPPERGVDRSETYAFGDGREGGWVERADLTDGAVHVLDGDGSFYLHRKVVSPDAREVPLSLGSDDAIQVWVNGALVHENDVGRGAAPDQDRAVAPLRAGRNEVLVEILDHGGVGGVYFRAEPPRQELSGPVLAALQVPRAERSPAARAVLREHYRSAHSPRWRALREELASLRERRDEVAAGVITTMIMREAEEPRPTHVRVRGQYDSLGEEVDPGVPSALHAFPEDAPRNRLGLARWLVSPENPLTARVIVNRYWAILFGEGLVRTPEDFGAQGDWPTHPELLDWLAVEFRESGWDTKALLRLMVTSTTYRQSAVADAATRARDPENRLLARALGHRLSAEMVRDQALAASGLLVERLGGPSVKPYQPAGLWREVAYGGGNSAYSAGFYEQDSGDALWRRSLYVFRKRSSPPPALQTFDAPNREVCVVRRSRTNTPLQALVLMNDPTYVEAARVLAERVLQELPGGGDGRGTLRARLDRIYERCLARPCREDETEVLADLLAAQHAAFAARPADAEALLSVGEAPRDASLDPAEHAAWTTVASVVFNLDEFVTRP